MSDINPVPISELTDVELDVVAAGWGTSFKQIAIFNGALQIAQNNQANAAFINVFSNQGGNQSNNNNAGNQA